MVTRSGIIEALHRAFAAQPWALAAWLGGSDATDRADALSDVDFVVITEDDEIETAFDVAQAALDAMSPIEITYRLPSPTWHGHEQAFYRLRDADPCHMIDFVAQARSGRDRFLETERHGNAVVLFDHEQLVTPEPFDRAAHDKRMASHLEKIRACFPLFQPLVTKAIRRGQDVEAIYFYQGMTLRPLVEALRMLHCPERYDFGLRYLDRDLPPAIHETVQRLAFIGDLETLEARHAEAEALFAETIRRLDARRSTLPA
jgi:hypothetical protein